MPALLLGVVVLAVLAALLIGQMVLSGGLLGTVSAT